MSKMVHTFLLSIMAILPATSTLFREKSSDPEEAWNGVFWVSSSGEIFWKDNVKNSLEIKSELCVELRESDFKQFKKTILVMRVSICLSMASILFLIIIHVAIEDLRVLYFSKLKIPFFIFLFITLILFIVKGNVAFPSNKSYAVILGLAVQYFSLGIFFWLTSMSLDIWLTFRRIANPIQNVEQKEAVLTYRMRLFYTFSLGGPAIISLVTGLIHFSFTPEELPYIHPRFSACSWMGTIHSRFFFFQLIVLTLLAINVIFYCLMVFHFTCGIWKSDLFGKNQMRNFTVLVELLFVMGIDKVFLIVGFFVKWQLPDSWTHQLDLNIQCVNRLGGVLILLFFFSKSNNRDLVKTIFHNLIGPASTH